MFITVLEALSQDFRDGLPKMLYVDDLVLSKVGEKTAQDLFRKWRDEMGSKGLKVNSNRTHVMISRPEGSTTIAEGSGLVLFVTKGWEV